MRSFLEGDVIEEEEEKGPQLKFTDSNISQFDQENLTDKALQNLRDRRMRLQQSEIFSAAQDDPDYLGEDAVDAEEGGVEKIDLVREQTKSRLDQGMVEMDDLDLLEATIDPLDFETQLKVARLEN